MNETEMIKKTIKQYKHPAYETTNGKEISVRCPYCGDSKKSDRSAHFYIEMTPPFKFYCHKCNVGGVLNQEVLRDLLIEDSSIYSNILEANKTIKRDNSIKKSNTKKTLNIPNSNEYFNSEMSIRNLEYFNNRFGLVENPEFVSKKFKVILNPRMFLEFNKLNPSYLLNSNSFSIDDSIGFISADNSHMILRDTSGCQKKRYFNVNLFPNEEISISSKIYNISSKIDILEPEIELVIAEGIFDIIGVYEHFYKDHDNSNRIFSAACGKGYNAVISHYARMGFLNLNVVIYSDADVEISFYKSLKNLSIFIKNTYLTVYYNEIEKDFGIKKENIQLRKAKV